MGTIHHYTERGPYVQQKMKRRNILRFRALGIDRAVENAELQDKLDKAQNELRRAQAELRLNQSDYERSQVETSIIYTSISILSIYSIHVSNIHPG